MSLREDKKRQMRQQLSDTATRMFVEHGFDGVRVSEVARACGVSEKTVFNYFPTKEALLLDRLEGTATALREALTSTEHPPIEAALRLLDAELDGFAGDPEGYRRFGDLLEAAPSLRAYRNDMMDRFVAVAAEALAARAGADPADPEPQITAAALLGLWRVQYESLRRHPAEPATVRAEVRRAADVLRNGLGASALRS
ncbi:TetR/AcrR family transcriptional regulator [Symbioplanes lichenis]|uniref:TetR/AcrR family transcriptional regulator n=1 Tax=Symbioplanes lichenis TaxID=1629072 RepID=UPI00273A44BF|nr:TetR family transcriptional regulator [Actinoplanes lichenis]